VQEKKIADANKLIVHFEDTDVQILNGRWGPYITDGKKNAKMPKEFKEKPAELDLETCLKLLEEAPERGRGKKKAAAKKAPAAKKKATAKKKASAKKKAKKKASAKKKAKASAKKKATAKKKAKASKASATDADS